MTSRLRQAAVVCLTGCLLVAGGCRRERPAGKTCASCSKAAAPADTHRAPPVNPRRTPLVELYDKCRHSVVNIHMVEEVPVEAGLAYQSSWGSGWILHRDGYIITAEHVINAPGRHSVILPGARHVINRPEGYVALPVAEQFDCRVIVRYPPLDIALLKIDRKEPFQAAVLGRSDDAMVGELAATVGNPMGLWNTFSVGIVTGLGRISGTSESYVYGMLQTDAGINLGNSGGPLFNAAGEVIGVIDGIKSEADNIGFAVAIDQLRADFADMMAVEMRYGFKLGLDVNTMTPDARVRSVAAESPAKAAGITVGDVITRVGETDVSQGLDFYLALIDRSAGEVLPITLVRDGEAMEVSLTLGAVAARPAVQAPESLINGLTYEAFLGRWERLPDFNKLSPVKIAPIDTVALPELNEAAVGIGLRMTGWLKVPADGLYTFLLLSDDGSRLLVGQDVLINNDFPHMAQVKHGLIRLAAGMHPITVEYFDRAGQRTLSLSIEGPGLPRQPIPTSMLFTKPLPEPPEIIDLPPASAADGAG